MALQLAISHSVLSVNAIKRFDADITVGKLKERLYAIVGTSPEYQQLQIRDKDGNVIGHLDNDDRTVTSYGVQDFANIHVIDNDPMKSTAAYADVNAVEKYEISEDAYNKRRDTFRNFKKGFQNPEEEKKKQQEKEEQQARELELSKTISVAQRCEIDSETENPKRGTVMFVGAGKYTPGTWVGIKLDEPLGKHDGSVKGHRYFECQDKYGVLVPPSKVKVGDYPEKDMFAELSDEDEDVMREM